MNKVVYAFASFFKHIARNFSNYSLLAGLLLVLNFIFHRFGVQTGLLSIGILLLLMSFILEINNINSNNRKRSF